MSADVVLLGKNCQNLDAWLAQLGQKLRGREVDFLVAVVQYKDEDHTGIHTFNANTMDLSWAALRLSDFSASRRHDFEVVE